MPALSTPAPPRSLPPSTVRTTARWLVSFVGFPLGGLVALLVSGPVDTVPAAVTGGLITGAVLGTAQGLALRLDRRRLLAWIASTATGLAIGLAIGASAVGFRTDLPDLVLQGAVSGLAVGLAQSVAVLRKAGPIALLWPAWLAAAWAIGWTVTTAVGVQVEDRFTVFGAAGAITVATLTAVLPLALSRTRTTTTATTTATTATTATERNL